MAKKMVCPGNMKQFGNICVPRGSRGYPDSGMRLKFKPRDIRDGIEISVAGYKADPATEEPIQVYIEEYKDKLRVHVWNGEQDPKTIEIGRDARKFWNF